MQDPEKTGDGSRSPPSASFSYRIDYFDKEKAMQIFPAVLICGLAFAAITAGTTVYSLRPHATSAASLATTLINTPAYPSVTDQNAYRAEQCGGDYVCDEKGAWLAISAAK